MTNKDIAKKNYDKGLWTDEMLDKAVDAGKLIKTDCDELKISKQD